MKGTLELTKLETFDRHDLFDIYQFCKIEGNLAPLLAVIFIRPKQEITNDDLISFSRLLDKYPDLMGKMQV